MRAGCWRVSVVHVADGVQVMEEEEPAGHWAPCRCLISLAGGRQGKLPVTAFEAFDLEARTWTRHPSLPSRRAFAGCAMAEGSVFSLGGLQQPGPHNFYSRPHFVNTVEMFDLEHGEQGLSGIPVGLLTWRGAV